LPKKKKEKERKVGEIINGVYISGGVFRAGESGNPGTDALNDDWLHIQGRKDRGEPFEDICPTCDGEGVTDGATCEECKGNGIVMMKGGDARQDLIEMLQRGGPSCQKIIDECGSMDGQIDRQNLLRLLGKDSR
jgi:hypothetical protein